MSGGLVLLLRRRAQRTRCTRRSSCPGNPSSAPIPRVQHVRNQSWLPLTFEYISCTAQSVSSQWQLMSARPAWPKFSLNWDVTCVPCVSVPYVRGSEPVAHFNTSTAIAHYLGICTPRHHQHPAPFAARSPRPLEQCQVLAFRIRSGQGHGWRTSPSSSQRHGRHLGPVDQNPRPARQNWATAHWLATGQQHWQRRQAPFRHRGEVKRRSFGVWGGCKQQDSSVPHPPPAWFPTTAG